MSEDGHRSFFAMPDGPYWEAKRRREEECQHCGGYRTIIDIIGILIIDGEEVRECGEVLCPYCEEDDVE